MSVRLRCRCGWEGSVDPPAGADKPLQCPACGAIVPAHPEPGAALTPAAAESASPKPTGSTPPGGSPKFCIAAEVTNARSADPRRSSAAGMFAKIKRRARIAAAWAWRIVRPAWNYIRAAFGFYWQNRDRIRAGWRLGLTAVFPALQDPELLRREIQRPLREGEGLANVDGVWRIDLPDRCVVCGGEAPGDWIEGERAVVDPYPLIAGPLAGFGLGLLLAWWYGSLVPLVVGAFLGVLAGYGLRGDERFLLRLKRCPKHAENRRSPELTVWHGQMLLRPGAREVKLAFLREPGEYATTVPAPVPAAPDERPLPETIPLADDVDEASAIIPERTDNRFPTADQPTPDPPVEDRSMGRPSRLPP